MAEFYQFIIEHGYTVVFVWIVLDQAGLPLPAVPLLQAAGVLAGAGDLSLPLILLICVLASVPVDAFWNRPLSSNGHAGVAMIGSSARCRASGRSAILEDGLRWITNCPSGYADAEGRTWGPVQGERRNMSIEGNWQLTIESPMGKREPKVSFKVEGTSLSGTFTGQMGSNDFSGGSVDGNSIAWTMSIQGMGQSITMDCQATIDGDELTGEIEGPRGKMPFSGKRSD